MAIFLLSGCSFFEHHHNYETTTVEPTKFQDGYTLNQCKCGDSFETDRTILISFESFTESLNYSPLDLPQYKPVKLTVGQKISPEHMELPENNKSFISSEIKNIRYYSQFPDYVEFDSPISLEHSSTIAVIFEEPVEAQDHISTEQKKINQLFNKVRILEKIASDYCNSPLETSLNFIRKKRYNSNQWNMACGKPDTNFDIYLSSHDNNIDFSNLQKTGDILIPSSETEIDFIHLAAILCTGLHKENNTEYLDLVSWGGDLCQFVKETKEAVEYTSYSYVEEKFLSSKSLFNMTDYNSDCDAMILLKNYDFSDGTGICLFKFYNDYKNLNRSELFKISAGFSNKNLEDLYAAIQRRLVMNIYINILISNYNLDFKNDKAVFNDCIKVFANSLN